MDEHAVINASPLILLGRSDKLFLLQEFYRRILVPDPVARVLEDLIVAGLYLHRRVLDEALKRVGE